MSFAIHHLSDTIDHDKVIEITFKLYGNNKVLTAPSAVVLAMRFLLHLATLYTILTASSHIGFATATSADYLSDRQAIIFPSFAYFAVTLTQCCIWDYKHATSAVLLSRKQTSRQVSHRFPQSKRSAVSCQQTHARRIMGHYK